MDKFITLAKSAVEAKIKENKNFEPPKDLPAGMNKKAGVFVSIHNGKDLRGCIGTSLPTKENIAAEIIRNAIAAATEDFRFAPIKKEELEKLSYKVDILTKPESIEGISVLDPKKYGCIVKTPDGRCGLLLPDLKGVDDAGYQVAIACQKGNIDPAEEKYLYRFEVKRHK